MCSTLSHFVASVLFIPLAEEYMVPIKAVAYSNQLSTQHSPLSIQHSEISTQNSKLSTQSSTSKLSTQQSALSPEHSFSTMNYVFPGLVWALHQQ